MTPAQVTAAREQAKLSKTELAALVGKKYRTVLRWEDPAAPTPIPRADAIVLQLAASGELPERFKTEA